MATTNRSDQASIAERILTITGEDALTIDRKFMTAWTGKLSTRLVLLTNELPRLSDASGALAKRFIVLLLGRSFLGQEDPALTDKLLSEAPSILNWAIEGYVRLRQRGCFIQPESSRDAIEDLAILGSPVAAFVKECCEVRAGVSCAAAALYEAWKGWCETQGRKEPGTIQTFGRDLRAAYPGLKVARVREADRRERTYEGISLWSSAASYANVARGC